MAQPLDPTKAGVLLLAFGGPSTMDEVRPFLARVLAGRPVPQERFDEVVHHYEVIGGRSPLPEITRQQAAALASLLAERGQPMPVEVGMRHSEPAIGTALQQLAQAGCTQVRAIVLAAYGSDASLGAYVRAVDSARTELAEAGVDLQVDFSSALAQHPGFVAANRRAVREALRLLPAPVQGNAKVIFTAHSIPTPMAQRSGYDQQHEACAAAVAAAGPDGPQLDYTLAYQSRSGAPKDPWLEPDVLDVIREAAQAGTQALVLAPIGFVSDHVEVLYDLDQEALPLAQELGLPATRAKAAGTDPNFIATLADKALTSG